MSSNPKPLEPVLAEIENVNSLGKSIYYEVVFHNSVKWCSYAGSDTFDDGEKVVKWIYISDIKF